MPKLRSVSLLTNERDDDDEDVKQIVASDTKDWLSMHGRRPRVISAFIRYITDVMSDYIGLHD